MQQRQMQLDAKVLLTYAVIGKNQLSLSIYDRALVGVEIYSIRLTFESPDMIVQCSDLP